MKTRITIFAILCSLTWSIAQQAQPIHATVYGAGDPILFIPGFTVPGEVWQPTVDSLKPKYTCHVLTLAGFGGTAPVGFPWLPQVNEAILKYIQVNNLKNLTIIGHSLGGTIGTWLAAQSGVQVKQLIIVDALPATGALMFPDFKPEQLGYDNPYSQQQLAMSDAAFKQLAASMAAGMSTTTSVQKSIEQWIIDADRKTYVYGYTDYLKLDVRELLKKITAPVTIIAAALPYGESVMRNTIETQYKHLKNYKLVVAAKGAHFFMLDDPAWFISKINEELID